MHTVHLSAFILAINIIAVNGFILKSQKNKREISCPSELFPCLIPLDYKLTQKFECNENSVCPNGYQCCSDSCFQHTICKRSGAEPEYCPYEKFRCPIPLTYQQTRQFLCQSNEQCPQGYLCCADSCFWHKVCKKSLIFFDLDDNFSVNDTVVNVDNGDNRTETDDVSEDNTETNLSVTESGEDETTDDGNVTITTTENGNDETTDDGNVTITTTENGKDETTDDGNVTITTTETGTDETTDDDNVTIVTTENDIYETDEENGNNDDDNNDDGTESNRSNNEIEDETTENEEDLQEIDDGFNGNGNNTTNDDY